MNERNRYKAFINYFKKWDGMAPLGMGLMVVGFLCLWLGFSFVTYLIAVFGMSGGLLVFLYGSIGRAHEADLQGEITHRLEKMHFRELEEDPRFRTRVPKGRLEERVYQAYDLHDGLYLKRAKSDAVVSSSYSCFKGVYLNDALYIKRLTFSFTENKKEEEVYDIPFTEIEDISVERDRVTLTTTNNKPFAAKTCYLVITYGSGKRLLLPAGDDIYTDERAQRLKERFVR